MILVTLGTQDKKFYRLLEAIDKQITIGNIKDEVIVQAGCSSDYKTKNMKIFDLIPMDEFEKLISECDILITHGGVGSIITGLKNNKKVIAAARLQKFGEHTNDHQLQIIENFSNNEYIIKLENFDDLGEILKNIKNFKPKKYKSNANNFNKLVESKIDFFLKKEFDFKKIVNILFMISIFLFIAVATLKTFFKPVDIVNGENRYANKYQKISLKTFLNGELQENYEDTLSDQLIFSEKLKNGNNYIDALLIKNVLDVIIDENNTNYYSLGKIFLYGQDNLVYAPNDFQSLKIDLDKKIEKLNKTMNDYSDVKYYFYYIEKDTDVNFETEKKLGAYEYIKENIESKNIEKFEINNFNEFSKYFYKTDHHWNYKGSYKAYLNLIDFLSLKDPKEINDEICFDEKFVGSKGLSTVYYEQFCAYTFDLNDIDTYLNGVKGVYGNQKNIGENEYHGVFYGNFYGSDEGEIIFDNHDNTKENILIIGNSYDNAILWLLAEKYNKTVSIDLRNYEYYMGKKFNYDEYLDKYNIDKVLFIGDAYFFTSGEFDVID